MEHTEERLAQLETAHRQLLARTLALEAVCLALLPTVCQADTATTSILHAAEAALGEALMTEGSDKAFTAETVRWFQRMRADALFPERGELCH